MHSARLLESLGSNTDFSSKFVDQGGLKQLLRLYTLKHLPPTFGSSSAAHALVAAVRVLNQGAVSSVTNRVVEALTGQLRTTLLLGMVSAVTHQCHLCSQVQGDIGNIGVRFHVSHDVQACFTETIHWSMARPNGQGSNQC